MKIFDLKSPLYLAFILAAVMLFMGCQTGRQVSPGNTVEDDGEISFIIIQMNDVYEIAPLADGEYGGLARVAALRKQLLAENPNVVTVIAGDFLNPSLIATIKYQGERIQGKQMVEVLNALNVDLAVYGNHEFDLDLEYLQKRMNESDFPWLGTNLRLRCGEIEMPFFREKDGAFMFMPDHYSMILSDQDGTEITLGFFGGCLASNPRDYVHYYDLDSCAMVAIEHLENADADLILGLTHQDLGNDVDMLKAFTNVPLIMGGHEHENHFESYHGRSVAKADANARTVYIHRIHYDKMHKKATISSELRDINATIPDDPEVKAIVDRWQKIMLDSMASLYPDPYQVIFTPDKPLDGREITNRQIQTNMGLYFTQAMAAAANQPADGAIMNSGSIRIDDMLSGDIRPYDIFRALPFGGKIVEVDMMGSLLKKVLTQGENSKGVGAYLQRTENIKYDDDLDTWTLNGNPVMDNESYHIVVTDYLLLGYDIPVLKEGHRAIVSIDRPSDNLNEDVRADIRAVVIKYLEGL